MNILDKKDNFYCYIQGLIDKEKGNRSVARKGKHQDEIIEAGAKVVAYEHLRNEFKKRFRVITRLDLY